MTIRIYDTNYRKSLNNTIKKVECKQKLKNILSIVIYDIGINKISFNKNGVFFNLNLLSDNSIEKINNIIYPCLT